jgi:hypothetical protein
MSPFGCSNGQSATYQDSLQRITGAVTSVVYCTMMTTKILMLTCSFDALNYPSDLGFLDPQKLTASSIFRLPDLFGLLDVFWSSGMPILTGWAHCLSRLAATDNELRR